MLNKQQTQKQEKAKIRKRDLKEERGQKTPPKMIDENQFSNFNVSMLFFHETKAKKQENKKNKKTKTRKQISKE